MHYSLRSARLTTHFMAVLCIAGCQQSIKEQSPALAEITAADDALQDAIAAKDLDRTVWFYAKNASLFPVAEPIAIGDKAIRDEWAHLFAIPGFINTAKRTKVDISRSGDLAYTQGTYATELALAGGKTATEHGKWVSIWKKQSDGSWKIVVDISNTDEPPPEHL
ncbi:MAG: DUF4440 domain-containing protein [Thermoanaerobaculia bacterium]